MVWLLLIFAAWQVVAHSEGERHRVSQTTGTRSAQAESFRREKPDLRAAAAAAVQPGGKTFTTDGQR